VASDFGEAEKMNRKGLICVSSEGLRERALWLRDESAPINDRCSIAAHLEAAAKEIEELREACIEGLWHFGTDRDRMRIIKSGMGWNTEMDEAVQMMRDAFGWEK
jgi:hypothetical protein